MGDTKKLGCLAVVLVACGAGREPRQAAIPELAGNDTSGVSTVEQVAPPAVPVEESRPSGPIGAYLDGLRWGMSHAEVVKVHTDTGGVIWKDYDEKLARARLGPEMTALEGEREQEKAAFGRNYLEFNDTPTGFDATALRPEYSYRNREALLWIYRQGKKRFFFFINDRLWKIYDEVRLGENSPLGGSFLEAVKKTNARVGGQGHVVEIDRAKSVYFTTVEWKDGASHLRLLDRSTASEPLAGVVVEENATLANLATLRFNREVDPTEIDAAVAAATRMGLSDPNAAKAAEGANATKKAPTPGKKKK